MAEYQLRRAAGKYWLLDMQQQGFDYHSPICLNESGAYLWQLYQTGCTREEIAGQLSREFGLGWEEALQDTNDFFNCIQQ
jgi:hypothetical protein